MLYNGYDKKSVMLAFYVHQILEVFRGITNENELL